MNTDVVRISNYNLAESIARMLIGLFDDEKIIPHSKNVYFVPMLFYDSNKSNRVIDSFWLVFYKNSNYKFVGKLSHRSQYMFCFHPNMENEIKVERISYHDSCWRDGLNNLVRSVVQVAEHKGKDILLEFRFGNIMQSIQIFENANVRITNEDATITRADN